MRRRNRSLRVSRPQPNHRRLDRRRQLLAERLEDRRLLAGDIDYGDAPDTAVGTGTGNYQTTAAELGPSHTIVTGLHLGARVDGDDGTLQDAGAVADDQSRLLADLAGDFVAGVTAGDTVSPAAAGGGTWSYFSSDAVDPDSPTADLQDLVWDTSGFFEAAVHGDPTDGFNGTYFGAPSAGEMYVHPRRFTPNVVARWTAGPTDSGEITIDGRVAKGDARGGDGIRFYVYVDGDLEFEETVAGTDGRGTYFTLTDLPISPGSTVEFVVNANSSNNDFDGTRLGATISLEDDEDGVVDNLRDLHLIAGKTTEVTVLATNETATDALVAGWIDYDANGVFDNASERAFATVPAGSVDVEVTLNFPEAPATTYFDTYARFRLSTDPGFVADPQPIGAAIDGEVEDYVIGRSTRIWDGEAGDNVWLNPLNWALRLPDGTIANANTVPQSNENILIPQSFAGETLTVGDDSSLRYDFRAIDSAAALSFVDRGRLSLRRDSRVAGMIIDAGKNAYGPVIESAPSAAMEIQVTGDMIWRAGALSRLTIDVAGDLKIESDKAKSLGYAVLRTHGDDSAWSDGAVGMGGGGIYNYGTFTTKSNGDIPPPGPFGPSGTLFNAEGATWIHDAPQVDDDPANLYGRFINHGVLDVRQGTLIVGRGSAVVTHRGDFLVAAEATLHFANLQRPVFASDSRIETEAGSTLIFDTDSGSVEGVFDVSGDLVVTGGISFVNKVTVPHLLFDGPSIVAEKTFTVTDEFTWNRGTLVGRGGNFVSESRLDMGGGESVSGLSLQSTRLINSGDGAWTERDLSFNNAFLQNDGTFLDASDRQMSRGVFASGDIINRGTWTVDDSVGTGAGGPAVRNVVFTNTGDFLIGDSEAQYHKFEQQGGTLDLGTGVLEVSGGDLVIDGGTVAGNGTALTDVIQNGGVIGPGNSPGTLTIDGDLTARAGQLSIEIAGPPIDESEEDAAGTNYDRLNVSGTATIDDLQVSLLGDFVPTLGSRYTVLAAASLVGPASDNAGSVGMRALGGDSVLELEAVAPANTPPIADAGGPYVDAEGSSILFDASGSTDAEQTSDSLTYQWDFDYDGVSFDAEATGRQVSRTFDNQLLGKTVAVLVRDASDLSDLATSALTVQNVAPAFVTEGDPRVTIVIDDNGLATLSGSFLDPGVNDTHSLEISWGDGTGVERVELAVGDRTFSTTHDYGNNDTGAPIDFDLDVSVYDETESSDRVDLTLVQPAGNSAPVADAGGPYVVDEGTSILFDASASSDVDQTSESLTYAWDFDYDGITFDTDATGRQVTRSFDNQFSTRTVAVMVVDDDAAADVATSTLRVQNVAPLFVIGSVDVSIDGDGIATVTGEFTDPGVNDSHTVEVNWDDESAFSRTDLAVGQREFTLTYDYGDNNSGGPLEFDLRVSIFDETESSDHVDLTLIQPFINTAPVADAGGPYVVDEGTPFLLDASGSTDANQASETLTYEWDFDYDGVTFVPDASGQMVSHSIDNNTLTDLTYAVLVTDAQGAGNLATASVTVRNVAPEFTTGPAGETPISVALGSDYLASLQVHFRDPGADSHRVTIDWGDGSPPEELTPATGERHLLAFHLYETPEEPREVVISATVTDQDEASDTTSIPLTINEPRGSLAGMKFDDRNANGLRDPEESGLSGWTIELVDPIDGTVIASTTTDADGNYFFDDVTTGEYVVREVQQTGWRQTYPRAPVFRISTDTDGIEADGQSHSPSISADGRFVAFVSRADNLSADNAAELSDVFVKDTLTGEIEIISATRDDGPANGPSDSPSISADGNLVVYRSLATNLVADDRNDASDIFLYDRRTGTTRRVSLNLDGDEGNDDSFVPKLSGDGRFVAFESTAANLVAGDTNGVPDVFVYDLFTGVIERVSVSSSGAQGDRDSYEPTISYDGRFVAFTSAANTFSTSDRDGDLDIYLYDRARHSLQWISRDFAGEGGNGDSFSPFISADGSTLAFASAASNLFPGDVNGHVDVFVADLDGDRLQRVTQGNGPSSHPSLTADGKQVLFVSHASDLIDGDSNYGPDVFLYDRPLEYVEMMGQNDPEQVPHFVLDPMISADASAIAFASDAKVLVADDTNRARDIFRQSRVGVHEVEIIGTEAIDGLDFGNEFRLASIRGQKFEDLNSNGQRDVDPETGQFVEPGLDGWTIRLVDARTGESWETVTASVDLDNDGVIDPITEQGWYEFGPLQPGEYEVYEAAQDGWFPSFPRLVLPPPKSFQAPAFSTSGIQPLAGVDPRIFVARGKVPQPTGPPVVASVIPAVSGDAPEQLPILYVKGFNDDGASWAKTGEYFTSLADVTGGQNPVPGSAQVDTYGIQFWTTDGGDENSGSAAGVANDTGFAVLQSLDELANPNNPYRKSNPVEFAAGSTTSILTNLTDPEQWIPVCDNFPDLSSCSIPALTFDFTAARSDYNQNGLAKYHADDLYDLLAEELGQAGALEAFSQVNFVTHSAGGLDTRGLMSLLQQSNDQSVQESVSNVIYTAPPFGGSTLAELAVPFFENNTLLSTIIEPWTVEVITDELLGPFETLVRAFIAEPIAASLYAASDYLTGEFTSLTDRLAALPSEEDVFAAIQTTVNDIDNLIKTVTNSLPGPSFGLAQINDTIETALSSADEPLRLAVIDGLILPAVKQALTIAVGLPGLPKIRDDLRPYEAIHENIEKFEPNLDVPQFVVWGEGGFLRYLTQMGNVDAPIPTPVNLGPPLDLAAADPRSLHAYGDANRNGLDFSDMDIQPGDGNLSRTSALFMTDLAGGYMNALAGFTRHTHGSISTNLFSEEDNIQGSFLENDDDNTASVGEVLVETFLTPVTALQTSTPAVVVNPLTRLYRLGADAEISFAPADREFADLFGRRFHVTADAVEYRLSVAGSQPQSWRSVNWNTFRRTIGDMTSDLGLGNEETFKLEWRSINQNGGHEAIRSAQFVIDTVAPSLNRVTVIDAEVPSDDSQIAFPTPSSPLGLLNSDRLVSRLDTDAIIRAQSAGSLDAIMNIDRDKTIRFTFDSPMTFEYAWNDASFSNPLQSALGDPGAGIAELLIEKRVDFGIPTLGFGVVALRPGTHTVYYRATDASGNASDVQSYTILLDDTAPVTSFSAEQDEIVGPQTPLTFFATDLGAGIGAASIDVPGIGELRAGSSFTLGETSLHDQVTSGSTVTLSATAVDRVDNATSANYSLVYDYSAPIITIEEMSSSVRMADGRLVATLPEMDIVVSLSDDTAGVDEETLQWSLGGFETGFYGTGTFEAGEDGKYRTTIPLVEGLNEFQVNVADLIGNVGSEFVSILRTPAHSVSAGRGDRIDAIDFGNSQFGVIRGTVFDDQNGNGVAEIEEPGIAGVTVYLDRNDNGQLDVNEPSTETLSRGNYQFANLFSRDYVVRPITPLGWELVAPLSGQHEATVDSGDATERYNFAYSFLGSSAGGTVYEDRNANGRRDPGEPGVDRFEVSLDLDFDGDVDQAIFSGSTGDFGFTGITPGNHLVQISDRDGWIVTTADRIALPIGEFDVIDDLEFGVYAVASIQGSVFEDADGSGDRDPGESDQADWIIEVDLFNDGSVDHQVVSTKVGFSINDVEAGTHRIRLIGQPGWQRTTPKEVDSFLVTVSSGDTIDGLEFGVRDRRGVIEGTKFFDSNLDGIRQPGEPGLAGWTIFADLDDDEFLDANEPRTVTDSDGNYSLRVVAGEYIIREVLQEGWTQTFPRSLQTTQVTDTNNLSLAPIIAGDYIAWVELLPGEPEFRLFDGTQITTAPLPNDVSIPEFEIDAQGRYAWIEDPDTDDDDDKELYYFDGNTTRQMTFNQVDDEGIVLVDGKIAWSSGESVLLFDGEETLLLSQASGYPVFDGEHAAFLGALPETRRLGVNYYDGSTVRSLTYDRGAVIGVPNVAGDYVVWFELVGSEGVVYLHDGAQTVLLADVGDGGYADVDESGRVVWLSPRGTEDGSDVMYFDGETVVALTNDGLPKEDLAIDDGIAVWRTAMDGGAFVSIFDGREVHTPDLLASTTPVVDQGLVAFAGFENDFSESDIYFVDARTFHRVVVSQNGQVEEIDFGNHTGESTVSGVVFDDRNADGQRHPSDVGLSRVTVELRVSTSNTLVDSTMTDEQGNYQFTVNPLIPYDVIVVPGPNDLVTTPNSESHQVLLQPGTIADDLSFGVSREVVIAGQVFHDEDLDGRRDDSEVGLNGESVQIIHGITGAIVATVETVPDDLDKNGTIDPATESGRYEIRLPRGSYTVRVATDSPWAPTNIVEYFVDHTTAQPDGLNFGIAEFVSQDSDGIIDDIEDGAPNDGDGNDDGIPDREQPHVASLPNAVDGTYVTVVAPEGTKLVAVSATDNPDPENSPKDVDFPVGFINFEIHDAPVGGLVDVTLLLHNSVELTGYYKYGPTPDNLDPHFYSYEKSKEYGVRRLKPGEVVVRFTDGLLGDDDLEENGIIVDPGIPGLLTNGPARNPVEPTDVNNDDQTTALDALNVINHLGRYADSDTAPIYNSSPITFLDVNGDRTVTALDALQVINAMSRAEVTAEGELRVESIATLLPAGSVDNAMKDAGPQWDDNPLPIALVETAKKPSADWIPLEETDRRESPVAATQKADARPHDDEYAKSVDSLFASEADGDQLTF